MVIAANITPTAESDGAIYCTSVPITSNEADLSDQIKSVAPVVTLYGQEIVAIVKLLINGFITGNSTYVVMQTDLGDGVWIDMAWVMWTQVMGSATFVLSGGGLGAMNNSFQQQRLAGSPPVGQTSGSNQMPLGGRVRFVGKTVMTGGSSSAPGVSTQVQVTITYRLQPAR